MNTRKPYIDDLHYCTIYEPGINIIDFSIEGWTLAVPLLSPAIRIEDLYYSVHILYLLEGCSCT